MGLTLIYSFSDVRSFRSHCSWHIRSSKTLRKWHKKDVSLLGFHYEPTLKRDNNPPDANNNKLVCHRKQLTATGVLCVYFRPRGERLQLRRLQGFEQLQPGPPAAFPQRGHHRGGAGGTDAAIRRWGQEGRAQAGRLAGYSVWNVQDGSDGTTRRPFSQFLISDLCADPERVCGS